MRRPVQRLRLAGVRICQRCHRGRADLVTDDGTTLKVALDPHAAHELAATDEADDVKTLSALVIAQLVADGAKPREIVFDVERGVLRALLSFTHGDDPEVIACPPQDGVTLGMRASLNFYATEEALEHASAEQPAHDDSDESAH